MYGHLVLAYPGGWYQINSNQSLPGQQRCHLCRAKFAPLGKSGGAGLFEMISTGEGSFLIEVVVDGEVNNGELLETLHTPEAVHGAFSSSEWKVSILDPIAEPTSGDLAIIGAELSKRSTV